MESITNLISRTEQILSTLISFRSIAGDTGEPIRAWVSKYLEGHGLEVHRTPFPALSGEMDTMKANLFTTIGPQQDGGICLSGHLDVVPAIEEKWTFPPFSLGKTKESDSDRMKRFYGRGTTDMKGFLALILAMVPEWIRQKRNKPVHLAFTYDEESGCRGAPYLIEQFGTLLPRPETVIVGEPTGLIPVIGHKGGISCLTEIQGVPAHSSNPSEGTSAIYIAHDIVGFLRGQAEKLTRSTVQDPRFLPPHSTLSVGTINGGTARNIIPEECRIVWEIRAIPGDSPQHLLQQLNSYVEKTVLPPYTQKHPSVHVITRQTAEYPPLFPDADSAALKYIRRLGCDIEAKCVTFGTEAGHYQSAGIPTVVWGPGDIAQAHTNNEFIEYHEMISYLEYLFQI